MRLSALLFAVLLLPLSAGAQRPIPSFEFRGVRIGDSLSKLDTSDECRDGEVAGERSCMLLDQSIGDQSVTIDYSYLDGRLYGVFLLFKPESFERLAGVLAARYGEPLKRSEPFRTVGGAHTTNFIHSWKFREGTFTLSRFGGSLTGGYGSITSPSILPEYLRRKAARDRASAARDLAPPPSKEAKLEAIKRILSDSPRVKP